jgi:hypothetical protein
MKYTIVLFAILISFTVNAQEQEQQKKFEFNYALRLESQAYAPINGITISDKGVPIGILSARYIPLKTNIAMWQAFDPLDGGGDYTAVFVTQPLGGVLTAQYIHFFDFKLEKQGANIFALKASGGEKTKWALKVSDIIFNTRVPRYILQSSLTRGKFTVHSWNFYEFGTLSWTMGVEWSSPKLSISPHWNFQANVVFNDSLTKRFRWSDGFGQSETFSIGLNFSRN